MELVELGVLVNMVNPDAVFGDESVCSGLWELIGPDRMKSRGLKPEHLQDYYCRRSLLKVKVLAEHVGNAVVFFASELTPTTGASLPVDAGNPGAFPRLASKKLKLPAASSRECARCYGSCFLLIRLEKSDFLSFLWKIAQLR